MEHNGCRRQRDDAEHNAAMRDRYRHQRQGNGQREEEYAARCGGKQPRPEQSWRQALPGHEEDGEACESGDRYAYSGQKQRLDADHGKPCRWQRAGEHAHADETEAYSELIAGDDLATFAVGLLL